MFTQQLHYFQHHQQHLHHHCLGGHQQCLLLFHCCFIGRVFQLNYQHLLLFVWNCFVHFAFFGKNKLNWITFKFNNCFIDWVSPLYLGSCVFFSVESFLLSILLICLEKKFIQKFLSNIFGVISVNKNFCLLHNLI